MSKSDLSQFTRNQLNNQVGLLEDGLHVLRTHKYNIFESGNVRNNITHVMRHTRRKLLQQDDWSYWQELEYLQLD